MMYRRIFSECRPDVLRSSKIFKPMVHAAGVFESFHRCHGGHWKKSHFRLYATGQSETTGTVSVLQGS